MKLENSQKISENTEV